MGSEGACTYRGRKDTPPVTPLQRAGVWCLRKASVTLRENRRRGGNPFREREVCRVHADEMIADGFYFDPLAATPKPVVEEEREMTDSGAPRWCAGLHRAWMQGTGRDSLVAAVVQASRRRTSRPITAAMEQISERFDAQDSEAGSA